MTLSASTVALLQAFAPEDPLRGRVATVLRSLPADVQADFGDDPRFQIIPMTIHRQGGSKFYLALPSPDGLGSRCVVLKPHLATCPEPFGLYVIAHELAHAFLRNGSWNGVIDREDAADALAAHWGFARPV